MSSSRFFTSTEAAEEALAAARQGARRQIIRTEETAQKIIRRKEEKINNIIANELIHLGRDELLRAAARCRVHRMEREQDLRTMRQACEQRATEWRQQAYNAQQARDRAEREVELLNRGRANVGTQARGREARLEEEPGEAQTEWLDAMRRHDRLAREVNGVRGELREARGQVYEMRRENERRIDQVNDQGRELRELRERLGAREAERDALLAQLRDGRAEGAAMAQHRATHVCRLKKEAKKEKAKEATTSRKRMRELEKEIEAVFRDDDAPPAPRRRRTARNQAAETSTGLAQGRAGRATRSGRFGGSYRGM